MVCQLVKGQRDHSCGKITAHWSFSCASLIHSLQLFTYRIVTTYTGKSVPLQAWSGPEGSRKLRFPDFVTAAQDGGKVVSLTHRPPLPSRKYSWYSLLLEAESTPGP